MKLNWINIKSAVIYGFVTMLVVFVLAIAEKILQAGSIFGIDWRGVIDVGAMTTLSVFVTSVSLVKNLLTSNAGKFLGAVTVIPDKEPSLPEWINQE